jgi:hypothetical protein
MAYRGVIVAMSSFRHLLLSVLRRTIVRIADREANYWPRCAMTYRFRLITCLSILLLTLIAPFTSVSANVKRTADGRPDEQLFVNEQGITEGALPLLTAANGFLTPPTLAPRPFTHMLLRWSVVADRYPLLSLRVSRDGIAWSEWVVIHEDKELWQPTDGPDLHWSDVIFVGPDQHWYQVRVELPGDTTGFRSLQVSTVDSRFGPAAPMATLSGTPAAIARPPVVSRTAWGNPHGQQSPLAPPAYYPVRHLVIHHTADANTLAEGQTWADRVRAIWSFHTYSRGWGDIGYNYLIDPNGVIYEGRAGGDDAVGFHDTANYGSMGVALIGTYSSAVPTTAALDSLVALLAWKADQKRIDPLGRSFYYGCSISRFCAPFNPGSVIDHISGHRQITPGHTTCPGDALFNLLPSIRQRVQARLAGESQPDNGDLIIEEHESGFTRSNANWYLATCGYGGTALYTFATDKPAESTNAATWRPNLPAAGVYRVLVYVPNNCPGLNPSQQARYRITTAAGIVERVVNQATQAGWVDLGTYNFAPNTASLSLSDLTGEPLSQRRAVLFDAVQWQALDSSRQRLELVTVEYGTTTLAAGEVLPIRFTVRNVGAEPIYGQDPLGGSVFDLSSSEFEREGYVYDEGECFLGATDQNYPTFPKEAGRFRVMLGMQGRTVPCAGETGGYPWRWGISGRLDPGQTQTIVGYVRFRLPGVVTVRAGAIHEYVAYVSLNQAEQQITITPERQPPQVTRYNELLQPLAMVYELANTPARLLSRTQNPLSIRRGSLLGSFVWYGELRDWGADGPIVNRNDYFLIEQVRTFIAPVSGEYTFELQSDDGAWLWVNDQLVVANAGVHPLQTVTGTITLPAGLHTLAIKYFELDGSAAVGYRVKEPGASDFTLVREGLVQGEMIGPLFRSLRGLRLSASDLGGGHTILRYSWDGETWVSTTEPVIEVGSLIDGEYHLRYQAIDSNGNESEIVGMRFRVDSRVTVYQVMLPLIER